jgi:hypothetical protein
VIEQFAKQHKEAVHQGDERNGGKAEQQLMTSARGEYPRIFPASAKFNCKTKTTIH